MTFQSRFVGLVVATSAAGCIINISETGIEQAGGGGVIASCSDFTSGNCVEITSGDAAAFQSQCGLDGGLASSSPCDSTYTNGPSCLNATFTSAGQTVNGNVHYRSNFCAATNNSIDTLGTCCLDLNGDPEGMHCRETNSSPSCAP